MIRFLVYDGENEDFEHPGLPPIPAAAPSLNALGSRLVTGLIDRISTGEWSRPFEEKI